MSGSYDIFVFEGEYYVRVHPGIYHTYDDLISALSVFRMMLENAVESNSHGI